jgi:beta-D-xylosidase 4
VRARTGDILFTCMHSYGLLLFFCWFFFRTSIALPGSQADLIEGVLVAANGKPVVLVIVGGGAVCLGMYKDDDRVSAIMFIGYPGQAAGVGVAEAIFGDYNPSGRLTQTFYMGSFVDEVSFYDMGMRARAKTDSDAGSPGRGYRFYTGSSVVYPFGHGLSYSTFDYSWSDVFAKNSSSGQLSLAVSIMNSGVYSGAETVLVFLTPPASAPASAPKKALRYFDKQTLAAGQKATVSIPLSDIDFSLADDLGNVEVFRGTWTVNVGSLTKSIEI